MSRASPVAATSTAQFRKRSACVIPPARQDSRADASAGASAAACARSGNARSVNVAVDSPGA